MNTDIMSEIIWVIFWFGLGVIFKILVDYWGQNDSDKNNKRKEIK